MLTYVCGCDHQLNFDEERAGSLERCPQCKAPFFVPFDEEEAIDEAPLEVTSPKVEPIESFATVPLVVALGGVAGLMGGYMAGALCVGAAILLNVIHNLLPVFIFVLPLIIVGFLAFTPAVYGLGVGAGVGYTAMLVRHRHGTSVTLIAMFWAVAGMALFPLFAGWGSPAGVSFFPDILLPFVRRMVGASLHFDWMVPPKPMDVPSWIVYTVLGLFAVLGVLVAGGRADDMVRDEAEKAPVEDGAPAVLACDGGRQ